LPPGLDAATVAQAWGWADEPVDLVDGAGDDRLDYELDYELQSDGSFAVWPENWDTVLLFWACRRCWRLKPMGGLMGMDWTTIQAKMGMKGLDAAAQARECARLELMEDAVMEALA
jgi:hypothetical protein